MADNPIKWLEFPYAPFINPLPPPEFDPNEPDLVCIQFNKTYIPYIIGALRTMIFSDMWEGETEVNGLAPARFQTLISIFQKATENCPPCGDCDDDCGGCGNCSDCEDC